jgi:hypothetical protein
VCDTHGALDTAGSTSLDLHDLLAGLDVLARPLGDAPDDAVDPAADLVPVQLHGRLGVIPNGLGDGLLRLGRVLLEPEYGQLVLELVALGPDPAAVRRPRLFQPLLRDLFPFRRRGLGRPRGLHDGGGPFQPGAHLLVVHHGHDLPVGDVVALHDPLVRELPFRVGREVDELFRVHPLAGPDGRGEGHDGAVHLGRNDLPLVELHHGLRDDDRLAPDHRGRVHRRRDGRVQQTADVRGRRVEGGASVGLGVGRRRLAAAADDRSGERGERRREREGAETHGRVLLRGTGYGLWRGCRRGVALASRPVGGTSESSLVIGHWSFEFALACVAPEANLKGPMTND